MSVILMILLLLAAAPFAGAQGREPTFEQHVEAARRAQAQQDCHNAALEYGKAAELRPRSGELLSNEGVALYCDGQLPEATAALKKALTLAPGLVAPHLFLGLASYRMYDSAGAARDLERFVALQPSDPLGHLWLGYTYVLERHYEAAIAQFEKVTQIDPGNMDAQYALGQCYLEVGRRSAQELARTAPNGALSLKLAGEQYELSGDTERARAVFQASAEKEAAGRGQSPSEMDAERKLYEQAHDAERKAQEAFQAVLRSAPESYRAHEISADVLVARQQQEPALAEYREVLRLNPTLPGIHEAISRCLMQGGHFAEALEELRAEQRLQPRSSHVLTEVARVELAMGDDTSGAASLREALSLVDPPAEAYLLMGKALLRDGQAKAAISMLQRYVGLDANAPIAYYLLARAYRATGERQAMESALATYRRSSEDAKERVVLEQATRDPNAIQVVMDAQEVQDATTLAASHP